MGYDNWKLSNGIDEQKEQDFDSWINSTEADELCNCIKYPLHELCRENGIAQDEEDEIKGRLLDYHREELEEYFNDN